MKSLASGSERLTGDEMAAEQCFQIVGAQF
jgi:hypothetical protein